VEPLGSGESTVSETSSKSKEVLSAEQAQKVVDIAVQASKISSEIAYKSEMASSVDLALLESKVQERKGRVWTQDGLVQLRQAVFTPWYLNATQLSTFKKSFPHVLVVPAKQQHPHSHPVLNIGREMAEVNAYRYIKRMVDVRGITLSDVCKVVDVGGNPSRHAKYKRAVHSTNPILSAADVSRAYSHYGGTNTCSHTAQSCNCVVPAAFLSVHSLYYLSPDDVASLVLKSAARLLVAVHHEFNDAFGSFAEGEATYQLLTADSVIMNVRGNSMAYKHSNLLWMRRNCHHFVHEGMVKTLTWSRLEVSPTEVITAFHVYDDIIPVDPGFKGNLISLVQDKSYYGDFSLAGPFTDAAKTTVPGDILSLPGTRVTSYGPSVLVYQSSTNITMLVPKGLVAEAANWCALRERSSDNFKNLAAYLRNKCRVFNIPPEILDSSITAAAALGFVKNVSFEAAVMHGVVNPLLPTIAVHRDALNLKFKTVWTWKNAAIVGVAVATGVASGLAAVGILAGPAAAIYAGASMAAAVGAERTARAIQAQFYAPEHKQTPSSLAFPEYHADRSSPPARTLVKPLPPGINLPATDPTTPLEVLVAGVGLDPSARLVVGPDPTENRERPNQGPVVPGAVVSTVSIPVAPSNSSHSSLSAISERILKNGPWGRGEVDQEFFKLFRDWVMNNLDDIGLEKDSVRAMPFPVWNSKYPLAIQKMHVSALRAMNDGDYNEKFVDMRGMFTKIESLPKSTEDGVTKLCPRGIQSGSATHNVATGPFCKAFSKRLAEVFSIHNVGGAMYTSGATSEEIGAAYQRATADLKERLGILEGDFARFDSTIHRLFLELEADIYKYVGASERAYAAFHECIKTLGRDKFGNKYAVDGGRHSGDHNTSCGNTLLQLLAIVFCCAFYDAMGSGKLATYREIVAKHQITLFGLGDDNLMTAAAEFLEKLPLKDLLAKLGLELEPKLHVGADAKFRATFCSARFWPVAGDKVVLGPGIGRGIAKSGWYVNPPKHIPIEQLVRGDSIGRLVDNAFIPFLGPMWAKIHQLTAHVTQTHVTADMKRARLHNSHATTIHASCPETYRMLEVVYGLTKAQEDEYKVLLGQVTKLPCIVDYAPLKRAAVVDGVAGDVFSSSSLDPIVEELPSLDPVGFEALVEASVGSGTCVLCGSMPGSCTCVKMGTIRPFSAYAAADDSQFLTDTASAIREMSMWHC
jgi:hypothetical protein